MGNGDVFSYLVTSYDRRSAAIRQPKLLNGRQQMARENTEDGYHNQVKHCSSPLAKYSSTEPSRMVQCESNLF